jgi:membrane-associated protease RseP (regulator of RpoE activity)
MVRRISWSLALGLSLALLSGAAASAQPAPNQELDQSPHSLNFYYYTPQENPLQVHDVAAGQHPWGPLNQFVFVNTNSFSGMGLAPVAEPVRAHLKLPKDQGLLVASLEARSPAAMAGIRQNDVLLKLGETPLGKVEDLEEALKAAGDKPVNLSLLRGGKPHQISVQPRVQVTLGPVQPEPPEFWIGVSVTPIEPALRAQLQLPQNEGLSVIDVVKDSAAAQARIRAHDILLRLGGKPLTDQAKMIEIVQANGEKSMPLELIRGGENLTLNVTPQRRKRLGLFWRAEPQKTFLYDFVRPGAVLSGRRDGKDATLSDLHGFEVQNLARHGTLLQNLQANARTQQQTPTEVSKRLDQMAEDIKQMRQAIEELTKAAKEKH